MAEDYTFFDGRKLFAGKVAVVQGKWKPESSSLVVQDNSLVHSAPPTGENI